MGMASSEPRTYIAVGLVLLIAGAILVLWSNSAPPPGCQIEPCRAQLNDALLSVAGAIAILVGLVFTVTGFLHRSTRTRQDAEEMSTDSATIMVDPGSRNLYQVPRTPKP